MGEKSVSQQEQTEDDEPDKQVEENKEKSEKEIMLKNREEDIENDKVLTLSYKYNIEFLLLL